MRFFIALEIPRENLLQFQAIQAKLSKFITQAKITDLDKIHLTLAFVGEQPDELKEQLTQIIKKASENIPSFEVTPAYIDGFPNLHQPQVLWVGVKGDIDKILLIRERIKDSLKNLHLPADERRFIPHITIAKLKNHLKIDQDLEMELEKIFVYPFDPIKISSIKLFASFPQNGLHKHQTLAEIKLGD